MITIDKLTAEKLDRFAGINARAERMINNGDEVGGCDLYTPEYHAMRESLNEEFLPLVSRLVEAGLINVSIDLDDVGSWCKFGDNEGTPGYVAGDAVLVFENGAIVIHANRISTAMATPLRAD